MIKKDARLAPYLNTALEDAGIEVEIDSALTPQDYAAIKVDEYYAGLRMAVTPKAVDFFSCSRLPLRLVCYVYFGVQKCQRTRKT